MNQEPIKITIQRSEDDKLELTTHWDSSLNDWEQVFRVILKWLTFSGGNVDEFFDRNEFGEKLEEKE